MYMISYFSWGNNVHGSRGRPLSAKIESVLICMPYLFGGGPDQTLRIFSVI